MVSCHMRWRKAAAAAAAHMPSYQAPSRPRPCPLKATGAAAAHPAGYALATVHFRCHFFPSLSAVVAVAVAAAAAVVIKL